MKQILELIAMLNHKGTGRTILIYVPNELRAKVNNAEHNYVVDVEIRPFSLAIKQGELLTEYELCHDVLIGNFTPLKNILERITEQSIVHKCVTNIVLPEAVLTKDTQYTIREVDPFPSLNQKESTKMTPPNTATPAIKHQSLGMYGNSPNSPYNTPQDYNQMVAEHVHSQGHVPSQYHKNTVKQKYDLTFGQMYINVVDVLEPFLHYTNGRNNIKDFLESISDILADSSICISSINSVINFQLADIESSHRLSTYVNNSSLARKAVGRYIINVAKDIVTGNSLINLECIVTSDDISVDTNTLVLAIPFKCSSN